MNILVMEGALRDNGGLRVVLAMAQRWRRSDHSAQYFVLQKVKDEASLDWRVPIIYGQPKIRRLRYSLLPIVLRVIGPARRADVIVSTSETGLGLLLGALAARIFRTPYVVVVQASLIESIAEWVPRSRRRLTLAANRHADASICVSDGVRASAIANGLPEQRAHVIRNGIDVDELRRLAAEDTAFPLRHPVIVGVGRLARQKGFDLLIRAHAKLRRSGFNNSLVIIGEGPERAALEQLIKAEKVQESVLLTGFMANPHPIVAVADVFCLSSRFEGFGLVLLEALALGTPIVSFDCPSGPAEILADGLYGDLVTPGSVEALTSALETNIRTGRSATRARAGRDRARSFDLDQAASKYLQVLDEVVNGRKPVADQRGP